MSEGGRVFWVDQQLSKCLVWPERNMETGSSVLSPILVIHREDYVALGLSTVLVEWVLPVGLE